jgi:hypothetical protein
MSRQHPSQHYYAKVYTDMLLDEAEKLYNKIAKDFTNKTISDPAILSESASSLSLLPQSDDDEEIQLKMAMSPKDQLEMPIRPAYIEKNIHLFNLNLMMTMIETWERRIQARSTFVVEMIYIYDMIQE